MTEGELNNVFDRLLARQPSDRERVLLHRTQKELGIDDSDSLWLVLVILGHYQQLYEEIPDRIQEVISYAVDRAKMRLEIETDAERARLQGALSETVLETIDKISVDRAKADRRWASTSLLATAMALFGLVGVAGYWAGWAVGGRSSNDAQLWAQSENGAYAYTLTQSGILGELKRCRAQDGDFHIQPDRSVVCVVKGSSSRSGPYSAKELGEDD